MTKHPLEYENQEIELLNSEISSLQALNAELLAALEEITSAATNSYDGEDPGAFVEIVTEAAVMNRLFAAIARAESQQ